MTDPYATHHEGLVAVHRALSDAFAPVIDGLGTPLDTLVPQARRVASFLLAHHDMETHGLFAGLRRHGHLRSTDVSFLDVCDREHHALHVLCDHLLDATAAPHPSAATITSLARDTFAVLTPHTREEEVGLAPERMRLMISEAGLDELGRELEALRERLLSKLSA